MLTVASLVVFFAISSLLGVTSPRDVPDTPGYRDFDFRFPLSQIRTVGYPVYLELHERILGTYRWVSWGHAVMYSAAVLIFCHNIPVSWRIRLTVLIGLMGTNIYWLYADTVATDTIAASMGLVVMGLTLRLGNRWTAVAAAGVCLFGIGAWIIRPAMLAVIPASLLTYGLINLGRPFRKMTYEIVFLAGLLILPVLVFSSVRLAMIGKFGIVSFGGYNLIGVVGQFPSAETAPFASPEARKIREQVGDLKGRMPPELANLSSMNYTRLAANYDRAIWEWYVPAAQSVIGDEPEKVNSTLRAMGQDILWHSPIEYFVWLAKSFRQAVRQTCDDLAESPMGLLGLSLAAFAICLRRSWPSSQVIPLVQLSFAYWASFVALTILVCPPLGRMTDAAALFMTPTILACAIDLICWEKVEKGVPSVGDGSMQSRQSYEAV